MISESHLRNIGRMPGRLDLLRAAIQLDLIVPVWLTSSRTIIRLDTNSPLG